MLIERREAGVFVADPGRLPPANERREAWQALDRLEPPYFVEGDKGTLRWSTWAPKGAERFEPAQPGDVL